MRSNNYFICGTKPSDVWKRGLRLIMEKGLIIDDERGNSTIEILNLMTKIENPFGDYPLELRERMLNEYGKTLLIKDNKDFPYTYGERLRKWFGFTINGDQIKLIIDRINNSPNTRRATATTWIPPIDLKSDEVPCMIMVDFKLREKLELTSVFRSNDFYGAWAYNVFALSKLLEYVAKETNAKKGGITILGISSHINENDIDNVKSILKY